MNTAPGVPVDVIRERLQDALQPSRLEVIDESAAHAGHAGANAAATGTHFRVRIASPQFTGRTRVAQHRLVYDALRDLDEQGLHALAIEIL
jgi:BolA protein